MPNYDSPISSKKFPGQPLREFTIPDESGAEQDMVPVMRHRGPAPHGPQAPVDTSAAIAYQNRIAAAEAEEADIERQIREAKDAKRTGKERLNDGARRRIEMLLNMTRTTREVDILGNVFMLQTLSSNEMREAIMIAAEYDNTVQSPFEIRRQLLARSLTHLAGVEISQFVGSTTLEAKLQLIDHLDESLLNRLFDEYSSLVQEAKSKFSIKNAEDVKDIVDDLKK